jgi:hypothetical protein
VGIAVGTQVETGGVEQAQNVLAGARRVLELGLKAVASRIAATSCGETSRSCGSAPAGVRFSTSTAPFPTSSAAYASG